MKFCRIHKAIRALLAATAMLAAGLPATTDSAAAQEPLIIGVSDDMAGPYSGQAGPGVVVATQMAVDAFGGKVLGRDIKILQADNQNKIDIGVVSARDWYENKGVAAIFGISSSSVALGVQEVARELNKMLIITSAASTDLTGKACAPTAIQWNTDAYSAGAVVGKAILAQGAKTWFFITVDYNFGAALQDGLTALIEEAGGKVVGAVKHPFGQSDFSSLLLQAQSSGADVIAIANGGEDMNNAIKNAKEFGILDSDQKVVTFFLQGPNIAALGSDITKGLLNPTSFVPGLTDESRDFSIKFNSLSGQYPSHIHAGYYTAVLHYLKAVEAAGTDEPDAVIAKMREMPVNDFMTTNTAIRADGRVMRDMYLVRVKAPDEMTFPFDYFDVVETVPGEEAFLPLSAGGCPLVQ